MNPGFGVNGISLAWRLAAWFIVVALLPLALFGYLSLRQNEIALRTEMQARMSRLADKKAMEIKVYLAERTQDAQLLARSDLTEAAMAGLPHAYTRYRPGSEGYRRVAKPFERNIAAYIGGGGDTLFYDVFLITPQGEIIYTYKHEPDFATNLVDGPYRNSQLAQVFRESRMTLESSISDFEHYAPSNRPGAFVSVPIIRDGKLLGVVALQLDTQRIYQVAMENSGLGTTGETLLTRLTDSGEAEFAAPLRHDPQAARQRKIDMKTAAVPIRNALLGQHGGGIENDYSGRQVVAAWRYLPELRWGMVVKMDADEALAPIYHQRKTLLQILLGLILLAGAAALYFGRRLVLPLKVFARTADEIAQGDLDKRVVESGPGEIGTLGRAFNHMAENLQSLYRSLENRVEERTRELNVSNEQLQEEIIEREHIEKALRENEELLTSVMKLLPVGVWVMDAEGKIIFGNAAGQKIWAGTRYVGIEQFGEYKGWWLDSKKLIGPHEWAAARAIEKGETSIEEEIEIECFDGTHKIILNSGLPLRRNDGGISGAIIVNQDITERKQAENVLRVAAATFETHEAILITDAYSNIIRVNRAFEDTTGYSAEEVLGKNPRILSSGRQDKAFYAEMWRQLLETGSWTGEMWDRRKNGQVYPKWLTITAIKNERGETTEYVAIFSDITARKQAEEEIRNLAFYDALTKLPNRRLLLDRFHLALSVSARSHHYGAVLFLDMDKFKTLNDTLGHDYGDLMLIEVAERIQLCVREVDTVARLGGDEFVVLIDEIGANAQDASQKVALIAEKIRAALAVPYQIKGHEYHSSPSIGVCLYRGNEESVDTLLKRADLAMYQAKDAGRNAVRFFDPAMQHAVEMHAALEADLRRAIFNRELHLYYQIQVDSEQRPLGAEALVRWMHPKRGMVSPAQFIPVAEESSLILDIGHWVLDTACRQLAQWGRNEQTRDLELAINVSAQQFRLHGFVDVVAAALRAHQVDPSRLKLELTESVVLNDVADVVEKMHALKLLGVKLSLDDFGTGYSSLSYLKQLPLDQIKIDQSFVRDIATDPNDAVMVKTIIDMAQNFRLNVIAEGVETEAQLGFLRQNGCMAYQGYLFSKPVPVEEFEALLGKLQGN